jgi:hypothetical protein
VHPPAFEGVLERAALDRQEAGFTKDFSLSGTEAFKLESSLAGTIAHRHGEYINLAFMLDRRESDRGVRSGLRLAHGVRSAAGIEDRRKLVDLPVDAGNGG